MKHYHKACHCQTAVQTQILYESVTTTVQDYVVMPILDSANPCKTAYIKYNSIKQS